MKKTQENEKTKQPPSPKMVRLREYMAAKGIPSVNMFSKMIGVNQNTLNAQFIGTNPLTHKVIMPLIEKCPDLSIDWVLRGVGSMFINECVPDEKLILKLRLMESENNSLKRKVARLEEEVRSLEEEVKEKVGMLEEIAQ